MFNLNSEETITPATENKALFYLETSFYWYVSVLKLGRHLSSTDRYPNFPISFSLLACGEGPNAN